MIQLYIKIGNTKNEYSSFFVIIDNLQLNIFTFLYNLSEKCLSNIRSYFEICQHRRYFKASGYDSSEKTKVIVHQILSNTICLHYLDNIMMNQPWRTVSPNLQEKIIHMSIFVVK